ncbi:permease [Aneurinibacillus terranovensis]|uniref:permease n=1 Tax=Aneurinibacillus terranovensis TaxID=278991 RepID=UPI00048747DF|nr:permease [Aneurinibacillus terranovensis]
MRQQSLSTSRSSNDGKKVIVFILLAAIGLFWAKWQPYFLKVFMVADKHSLGKSILIGSGSSIPAPSWAAALGYAETYFLAIWKALLVAVIVASLVQVLVPRDWIVRVLGKTGFAGTVAGGLLALPGMMCTCCAAPIVIGLRKCKSSVGAAVAFWFGNTALNPAVLIFMFFVLGWKFVVLRIVIGIILVFGISYVANRIAGGEMVEEPVFAPAEKFNQEEQGGWMSRWIKAIGKLLISIVPVYILSVLVLGFARAWLFPAGLAGVHSILLIVVLAVAGTFFVIPTAAEIPIIQSLLAIGIGSGPAAALLLTLPVISLPSILMVRKSIPANVLLFLLTSVCALGILSGLAAMVLF